MESQREYSFVDVQKIEKDDYAIENMWCFYWERLPDGTWKRKKDVFENKDYYFYVGAAEAAKKKLPGLKYSKEEYITVEGKPCIKVTPEKNPGTKKFRELRELFEETYEADVTALTRWIGKNKPKYSKNVRKLYIDIETLKDEEGNYGTAEKPSGKIVMICCYDSFTEKYTVFCIKKPKDQEWRNSAEIIPLGSETGMVKAFCEYLQNITPDYILGWNIESYDIPYLINRMNSLGLNKNMISPMNSCWMRKQEEVSAHRFSSFTVTIKGLGMFDLMSASQRLWLGKYCGYSLNAMSTTYLKDNKIAIPDIDKSYTNDYENLINYNIKDVELCVRLDKELKLFYNFQSFQGIISININECLVQSRNIVQYFLQHTDRVLLNAQKGIASRGYEGAVVLDTKMGIFKNCYKFDFVSMYPSIIITYNMSPDTILQEYQPGCLNLDNKFFFRSDREGIVTKVVKELYFKRLAYKKEKNEQLSLAYKLLMNSIYGQFAAPYSRIFSFGCADGITYMGRRLINTLCDRVKKNFQGSIIMGDTDSFCFYPDGIDFDSERIIKLSEDMFEDFYKEDNVVKDKFIKLEMEKKITKMIIFGSEDGNIKKKYVEVIKKMKLNKETGKEEEVTDKKLTGLDAIKSDTVKAAKDLQNTLVTYLIDYDKPTYSGVNEIVEEIRKKFLDAVAKKDYMYFAIPAKLNKSIESYAGVDKNGRPKAKTFALSSLENSKLKISVNERFFILVGKKTKGEEYPYAMKTEKDVPGNFIVDTEYMWERIKSKAEIFYFLVTPPQKKLLEYFTA